MLPIRAREMFTIVSTYPPREEMYPVDRHTIQWLDVCCYSELLARGLARVSCRLASGWRKGTICFNDCYVVHGWDIVIPHTNRELLMLIVIYTIHLLRIIRAKERYSGKGIGSSERGGRLSPYNRGEGIG